ncbi:MAG: response regulator transcription factor [Dehalococcoidia bacterium]
MNSTNGTTHPTNGRTHPAPTVLMVDDDPGVLGAMSEMLELEGYAVRTCVNGREAIQCFETLHPSVVILDMRMPELDGLATCRMVRAKSDVPILMLTALDDEWDAAHALESGADDYIRKPVGACEFVARVRAALRRSALVAADATDPITIGHIVIDVREHEVHVDGRLVELSPIELRLLTHLAMSQNHVLTHDDTLTTVWGAGYSGSRHVLRVTMSRLRQKLALTDSGSVRIVTVEGVGYRLIVQEPAAGQTSAHHEAWSQQRA